VTSSSLPASIGAFLGKQWIAPAVSGIFEPGDEATHVQGIDRRAGVLAVMLVPSLVPAQQSCTGGIHINGMITDPTGTVIPGAQVQATSGERATTNATGHYLLPCISGSSAAITVQAEGFSRGTARAHACLGETAHVNLQFAVASVQTDVQVSADASGIDGGSGRAPQS
jgi:hypothetical protein